METQLKFELLGILFMFLVTLGLSIPLGKYIANVFSGKKTLFDRFMNPFEKLICRFSGIDATKEMNWKEHIGAMLMINLVWLVLSMIILMTQKWLPLNPDGNPNMSFDLALNTAISFVANCNLQHYSGESGVSYFSQIFALMFLQFVSAATGIASVAVLFNALKNRTTTLLGNFYLYFIKTSIRILLPLSLVVAIILLIGGTPMTFDGKANLVTMQGDSVQVSTGPAAGFVAIKHVGTNGGGFFGANSAHPLENPNYLTNFVEMVAQMILSFALIFALGFYLNRKKLSWMIFGVMTLGFMMLVLPAITTEIHGNPAIEKMGIDNGMGAMEGKEVRFGAPASAYWSIATTAISTGSVNSMHDSSMPISGLSQMLAMMTNAFYGGVGVGILNYFIFIVLAVFISGLMVGRTPEFMGKKIEAREMKIAMMVALLHPLLILAGTAMSSHLAGSNGWLSNPGYHGFSQMLYEFTSASANNGSGFEGLGDNNLFWNISTAIVMLLGRFLPIIGPIAIAGSMAGKKYIPEGAGTLKTDTFTFSIMVFVVILIIAALSFFPALTLGPIAEHFTL
jgi:potassium-transporting ATPase potassium-binding subunit